MNSVIRILSFIIILSNSAIAQSKWARLEASDGLYSLILPRDYNISKDTIDNSIGRTYVFNYYNYHPINHVIFNLMDTHYAQNIAENNRDSIYGGVLQSQLEAIRAKLNATIIYSFVESKDFWRMDARLKMESSTVRIKAIARNDRMILMQAFGDGQDINTTQVEDFFNSLRFIR